MIREIKHGGDSIIVCACSAESKPRQLAIINEMINSELCNCWQHASMSRASEGALKAGVLFGC